MSLNQWSTLYLTESKCNIPITTSKIQRSLLLKGQIILLLIIATGIYLFSATSLILVLVSLFIYLAIINTQTSTHTSIVLHDNGNVSYMNREMSLHKSSRIVWCGCWLVLTDDKSDGISSNNTFTRLFFFKDQFSDRDFSRVCRHIMKNGTSV